MTNYDSDYHTRKALANCEDCNLITEMEARKVRKGLSNRIFKKPLTKEQDDAIRLVHDLNRAFGWSVQSR